MPTPFAGRLSRAALVVASVAVVAAACGTGPASPPAEAASSGAVTPSATAGSSSPIATVTPTESAMPPEPSPSTSAEAGPGKLPFGEVAAGTYANPRFKPLVTLTVGDGWTATTLTGFFDLQQRRGTPQVIAVQFANVDGVVGADQKVVVPAGSRAALRAVRNNPGVEVIDSSESQVGGLSGQVVEIRNTSGKHASVIDVPPGLLGIDSGRALWIAFLDTPDGLVAVMVGGPTDGWDEALAIAEPVLDSLVIGS